MKRDSKMRGFLIGFVSLVGSASAMASPATTQMNVAAQLENSCVITNPLDLSFEYKNSEGHLTSQAMGIKCTTGATYKVSLNYGLNGDVNMRRLTNGVNSDLLNYQIFVKDSEVVVGDGNDGTHVFEGVYAAQESLMLEMDVKVPSGQYVSQGTYVDTILTHIQY